MLSYRVPARVTILAMTLGAGLCAVAARLNGAESVTNLPPPAAVLPLELRRGAVLVRARVNDSQPLAFKLDTGFGVTTIHPALVEPLGLRPAGRLTINGIAGREPANWLAGATFNFADLRYAPRRVATIPSEAQRSRRDRDGILGAGFFRQYVVELDFAARQMTLREPATYVYEGDGEIIPLQFRRDTPTVEATIHLPGREPLRARYEIDSGCDGGLCLGHDFVRTNRLDELAVPQRDSSRTGVGGRVETRETRLPRFQLGEQQLTEVEANFFQVGSPGDEDLAGHIGLAVWREFKVIFDYSRRRMILERVP